jgi:hypothetical protein
MRGHLDLQRVDEVQDKDAGSQTEPLYTCYGTAYES